jgi:internalin A
LRELPTLAELSIDERSVPALSRLAGSRLRVLHIMHTDGIPGPIDLSPVADLASLEKLEITPARMLTLSPLRRMSNLSELTIIGTGVSFRDMGQSVHLEDPTAISELRNLKKLGLAWLDIKDADFLTGLNGLEEIFINQTPLSDIRALGSLGSLRSVQLAGTNVVDITPLLNLTKLKTLIIQATPARLDVVTELQRRGVVVK